MADPLNKRTLLSPLLYQKTRLILICLLGLILISCGAVPKRLDQDPFPLSHPVFFNTLEAYTGAPILKGNRVRVLLNGDEFFPAMLKAIRGAKQSITFVSYVYWRGQIADEFAEILAQRAREGIPVYLLLDSQGAKAMDEKNVVKMREAGVHLSWFRPLRWYKFPQYNYRTHRKILVVDGKIGFTGGIGIGQEWAGHAQDPDHWRETCVVVEGPVVHYLQAAFAENWMEATGTMLVGNIYFHPLEAVGPVQAQGIRSSPMESSSEVYMLYLLTLSAAERTLYITTAYFLPDDLLQERLIQAVQRGVDVRVVLPGKYNDNYFLYQLSRNGYGKLLKAGVKIYEYQPTFIHAKAMVADGIWGSIGSTNFDNRSFSLNDEFNLNFHDREVAGRLEEVFQEDLDHSRRVSYEEWEKRPYRERFVGWLASWIKNFY
ncbi:MAG: cardiolipin synthase B [Nitrospirae bacterium]|nr:cardiolipin synthase B [Candidatus Manganitrophaceae bacterium]